MMFQLKISHELDFYSVDFRGELSAFDGEIMRDQSEFVNDCIGTLLHRYKRRVRHPFLFSTLSVHRTCIPSSSSVTLLEA